MSLDARKIFAHSDWKTVLDNARGEGAEVVGVLGLGFVGTAVAANLARARNDDGKSSFFVIGIDADDASGRQKTEKLNRGFAPTYSNDIELENVIRQHAFVSRNLTASTDFSLLELVDTVVICINLDLHRQSGQTERLSVPIEKYENVVYRIGLTIHTSTFVVVESTLPIGMCDQVLYPALCRGQREQGFDTQKSPPLLAYCYERVMPGPHYLDSVNNYWRSYAGINSESVLRAKKYLEKFVNTVKYPLWEHKNTRAAEMAKLMENSYRAANIAFIDEWANLAESCGVDLWNVIASIRVRTGTHDNMMSPGLGAGGYCLTKDALLAAYGAEHLIHIEAMLPFSRAAILTNEKMTLKAFHWVNTHFEGRLQGKKALLVGITYRPGVADTRTTASEALARELLKAECIVTAYDPLMGNWPDLPNINCLSSIEEAADQDIILICLPDHSYLSFLQSLLEKKMRSGGIVVDPWNMLNQKLHQLLLRNQVAIRVYGRGNLPDGAPV